MKLECRFALLGSALMLCSAWGSVGCSSDLDVGLRSWQDEFVQAPAVLADVLFVVDNSQSMEQEQDRVVNAFEDFITNIQESHTDFQIGVTSTDMSDTGQSGTGGMLVEYNGFRYISSAMDPSQYAKIFEGMVGVIGAAGGSGYEKGLQAARSALYPVSQGGNMGSGGYNNGFLRSEATLAIIFVSDEDDCSDEDLLSMTSQQDCYSMYNSLRPVYEYTSDYLALKTEDDAVVVSAIVGPKGLTAETECGKNTVAGARYIEATEALHGVVGNICESDFSSILNQMGLSAAGIQTRFPLSRAPQVESIQVYIDDKLIEASEGWSYIEADNVIECTGAAIPPRGTVLRVTYLPA